MNLNKFLKHEKILWHNHFIPSLLAGLFVAALSYIYHTTIANIVLFASVGASAAILTNTKSHHLTRLHTAIVAYIIVIIFSSFLYYVNQFYSLHMSLNIFLIVFLITLVLFLLNSFHPPAVAASLSFILLERPLIDLIYLFLAIVILLVLIRYVVYVFSQHLSVKDFVQEFKKSF